MKRLWAPWRMEYLMSDTSDGCIFCDKPARNDDRSSFILMRTPHSFVMLNTYPYNNGHLMIAPHRHVGGFAELTDEERCDLMDTIAAAQRILERAYSPQGMNVGANIGHCAGAGVPGHVHVHIVPRWEGDTNFMPVVGETRVLPETLEETFDRLSRHVEEGRRG